ncbi:BrnT family toxin [Thiomonas delicata]|nr:BrnT family toxin [Thiomonas delicata]
MGVEFDPAKARSNLRKHGVSFAHAEDALHDGMALTIEDPDARGEQRFVTLGMDSLGRVLVVVHTQPGRNGEIPCVKTTISAKASAARSSPRQARSASPFIWMPT